MLSSQRRGVMPHSTKRITAGISAMLLTTTGICTPVYASGAKTPIEHVIVIIGENRTFDHIFATYKPAKKSETVLNLLSEGIVKADGLPGPNYSKALQYHASDAIKFQLNPSKTSYATLPPALTGGPSTPNVCQALGITTGTSCDTSKNVKAAEKLENGLSTEYYKYLLTGGTGQDSGPDKRIKYDGKDASTLPPGPYQLSSKIYPYDSYGPSPVHRFFQMWQQLDCSAAAANSSNGSGCLSDLFAWVEQTIGAGSNGADLTVTKFTGEGSTSMGFYNMQQGDAPYLKSLAESYTMSDNYHQPVNGGTGANHIMLGTGDAIWFSDGAGTALAPPESTNLDPTNPGTPLNGATAALQEIENPDPQQGTNNYYTQDGYGGGSGAPNAAPPKANYGGGSYVNCSDATQPGVPAVLNYLGAKAINVKPNCDAGHYYLLNNYNPGYFGDGSNAYTDTNPANYVYTIPPSSVPTIGDELNANNISWVYYGDQWNQYLNDKYQLLYNSGQDQYCNICNWAQYSTSIMTSATARAVSLKDTTDLYSAIEAGNLPAVSYVKPSGLVDGHPASSKLILFEGFVKKIVDAVKANKKLFDTTAIFITFDEGGGYWDSGYVQPLDFFGDGTRIPMIVVSKYSEGGHISHTYTDHVSVAKFIEANWGLGPISSRSRDNFPNPTAGSNPYIPANPPAIGDLMDMFVFKK
jgi:phospholipase C